MSHTVRYLLDAEQDLVLDRGERAMQNVTVQEAQSHLTEIIEKLPPGEEVVITRDDKPVAALRTLSPPPSRKQRQLGTLKGSVLYLAPDFDALPEGFEDYVE